MVQIIQHSPDPAAQRLAELGDAFTERTKQLQAMQLTKQDYELRKQAATDAREKEVYARRAKLVDWAMKISEEGGGKNVIAAKLKMMAHAGGYESEKAMWEDMGHVGKHVEDMAELLSSAPGTKHASREGQGRRDRAQAEMIESAHDNFYAPGKGRQAVMGEGAPAAEEGAPASGGSRGQWEPASMDTSGNVQFRNPSRERQHAMLDQQYTIAIAQQGEIRQIKGLLEEFNFTTEQAQGQMGGASDNVAAQAVKNQVYNFIGNIGSAERFGEIIGANKKRDAVGLALASLLNRGRPNETDWKSAVKMLPHPGYPPAINKVLNRLIDRLTTDPVALLDAERYEDFQSMQSMVDSSFARSDSPVHKSGSQAAPGDLYDHDGNPAFRRYVDEIQRGVIDRGAFLLDMMIKEGMSPEEANATLEEILRREGF